jgi:hypothetical protein
MDFEIEGDDSNDYNFDWSNEKKPPKKNKSSFFGSGGGNDEEENYDFSYQNEKANKNKSYSPPNKSYDYKVENQTGNNSTKNVVQSSVPESAMERAQNMLNKYSNKNFNSAPPRNQRARTFNEDDISLSSSDGEPSDFEMSASNDDVSS